jgi:hypothetical protein
MRIAPPQHRLVFDQTNSLPPLSATIVAASGETVT